MLGLSLLCFTHVGVFITQLIPLLFSQVISLCIDPSVFGLEVLAKAVRTFATICHPFLVPWQSLIWLNFAKMYGKHLDLLP